MTLGRHIRTKFTISSLILLFMPLFIFAQSPTVPPVTLPGAPSDVKPVGFTPEADQQQTTPKGEVRFDPTGKTVDGQKALPTALADARSAYGKVRDYMAWMLREERVQGVLKAEQTCELRVRATPFSVAVRVITPKTIAGQETVYMTGRLLGKVRFLPSGPEGVRTGYQTLAKDNAKVLAETRHSVTDVGIAAVLDRVESALTIEKKLNHPVQVLMADYKFANKAVKRYELFMDRPHSARYARRMVMFIDTETKLPIRFEAYGQASAANPEGELLERVSFLNLKLNVGLGESAFVR